MKRPIILAVPMMLFLITFPGRGQERAEDTRRDVTPKVKRALEKALAWLARSQKRNGAVGGPSVPVATTAMAGLAWLAAGNSPGRGKYGKNVKLALDFILRNASPSTGYINEGVGGRGGGGGSGSHGHGYAMCFLGEIFGMVHSNPDLDRGRVRRALRKAVKCCERYQASNGGWGYELTGSFAHTDEGSCTIPQIMGLRAARNAGIAVSRRTLRRIDRYMRGVTGRDGTIAYQYGMGHGGGGSVALTAAGMSIYHFLGKYDSRKLKKGLNYLRRNAPWKGSSNYGWTGYPYYTMLYATIAMYLQGGKYWKRWWPRASRWLMRLQNRNGSFKNDRQYGGLWTAFAALTLAIPYRLLPLFQR
jgi:hypothetical protein